ncbi:MAG: hypothetical protein P4M15_08945 [Alphaproteobacteria bacterium]|nr:hypothetical protein [Alphaproteobacteria bacterium]
MPVFAVFRDKGNGDKIAVEIAETADKINYKAASELVGQHQTGSGISPRWVVIVANTYLEALEMEKVFYTPMQPTAHRRARPVVYGKPAKPCS